MSDVWGFIVCVDTWTPTQNTHGLSGAPNNANTLQTCQTACAAETTCLAIDFTSGDKCYLFTQAYVTAPDTTATHYTINRCGVGRTMFLATVTNQINYTINLEIIK